MTEPTEFVLLVSARGSIRVNKRVLVQLHGIDLEEAYQLLMAGGHLSSAWTFEDFLISAQHGQLPGQVAPRPIPAPMPANKEGVIPFAFGDDLVRAKLDDQGDPWFVAKDVCKVLGISNSRDAISDLDEDEKADVGITDTSSSGVSQRRLVNFISESGLYSLIFRSRKEEAQPFRRWVTKEVLPSIRRTGAYRKLTPSHPLKDGEKD